MVTNTLQPQSYNQNAAPLHQQIIAQSRIELLLTLRRGESGLIIAKVISVLALEFIQVLVLISVAVILYGWRPGGSPILTLLVLAIGTVTFSALGLAMAGALRAEVTLAAANGLYLLFLLLGGGILPLSHLPPTLAAIAQILPAAALTQALQATMSSHASFPLNSLIILVIWAIAILVLAMKTFNW